MSYNNWLIIKQDDLILNEAIEEILSVCKEDIIEYECSSKNSTIKSSYQSSVCSSNISNSSNYSPRRSPKCSPVVS